MLEKGDDLPKLMEFFDIQRRCAGNLFEGALPVWHQYQWYAYPGKKYALSAADIMPLLKDWNDDYGCFAPDRITVDGCKVGYMRRRTPLSEFPDSGWEFFAGDESSEYSNDTRNLGIYDLKLYVISIRTLSLC
jgi:hypothetical protein